MREILFRAKATNREDYRVYRTTYKNGDWVYGLLTDRENYLGFAEMTNESGVHCIEVDKHTIGQFTGLTDKNGKKIFEGDCWVDNDGDYLVYVVEFREAQFCFVCYGTKGALMEYGYDENAGGFGEVDCFPMTDYIIDTIEIVGNIHDSPELLKGK